MGETIEPPSIYHLVTWFNRNTETGLSYEAQEPRKFGQKKCRNLQGVIEKRGHFRAGDLVFSQRGS